MDVLGLHITGDQSSACLLRDGKIIYGAAEERFTRQKRSREFPNQAIDWCLKEAGIGDLKELDAVAMSWNPVRHMELINMSGFTSWRRYDPEWLYIVPNNLRRWKSADEPPGAATFLWDTADQHATHFVDHHISHLAFSYYDSPFERCAALIVDEYGEIATTTLARAAGTELEILHQCEMPHSIGAFYSAFTEFLGFQKHSDEWKVMGAAAYGDAGRLKSKVGQLIHWDPERLQLLMELRYFNNYNMRIATYLTEELERHLGMTRRHPSDDLKQEHYDLCAAVQSVFEDLCTEILISLHKISGEPNLVLGGGSAMNSLFNGMVLDRTPFERIFVPYAAADNGCAMGAALWTAHNKLGLPREIPSTIPTPYIGPEFDDEQIEATLIKYKVSYERPADVFSDTVDMLCGGKIIGWFQGRMEFGERALGNRSILADPRHAENKTLINAAIKYREAFRPFAPSVLEESMRDYFDVPDGVSVPYMEQVYPVRPEKRSIIPAVTHDDGTGRLQTVSRELNPCYYELIECFSQRTGVPVLLNTSFNVQGEPIVCTPSDALRTFISSGLDALVLGSFVVRK